MRRMLGDAVAVLVGVMAGIAIVVGAAFWLLWRLAAGLEPSTWDGTVPFVADCELGQSCRIVSVAEKTPGLAVNRKPGGTVGLAPVPTIAGLKSGDRVTCTLHVELFVWGQANDPEPTNTVENCHLS